MVGIVLPLFGPVVSTWLVAKVFMNELGTILLDMSSPFGLQSHVEADRLRKRVLFSSCLKVLLEILGLSD